MRTRLFAILLLVLKMKVQECYFLLLVSFLCLFQGKIDEHDFRRWKATCWMEVSRNASGIESWKVGSTNLRWYSWQPNHGDRGDLYTMKPGRPPKFGSPEPFPPGFSRTVACLFANKLQNAFHHAFTVNVTSSNSTNLMMESGTSKPSLFQGAFRIAPKVNGSVSQGKLHLPIIPDRIPRTFYPSQDTGPPILANVNETDLALESTRRFAERRALRERRQAIPDAITGLGLSKEQHRNLKARVNRRFLVSYDCSKPMDVKPISSFIHDPCESAEANAKETYETQPETQFQIVQYETRRESLGTRCERYISQFTYYCRNADHASPLPQETFFRCPKILAQNECRALQMGQYRAGDGKTHSIAKNV